MPDPTRRHHRMGVALEMRVRGLDCYGIAFEENTESANVSRGGCSFRCTHEVAVGVELELEIYRTFIGRALPIPFLTRGLVLRVNPDGPEHFTVGVEFSGPHFPTFASEASTATPD